MATFELDGRTITVLDQDKIELDDLAYMKEHFDISGQVELQSGLGDLEPEAWRALLVVSARREFPDLQPRAESVGGVPILPLLATMNQEAEERIAAELAEATAKAKGGGDRPTKKRRTRESTGT